MTHQEAYNLIREAENTRRIVRAHLIPPADVHGDKGWGVRISLFGTKDYIAWSREECMGQLAFEDLK